MYTSLNTVQIVCSSGILIILPTPNFHRCSKNKYSKMKLYQTLLNTAMEEKCC